MSYDIEKFSAEYPLSNEDNKEKLENQLLSLIDKNENVLTIRNVKPLKLGNGNFISNSNLGMVACRYGLEKVVLRALDNKEAQKQTDNDGKSLLKYAAELGIVPADSLQEEFEELERLAQL